MGSGDFGPASAYAAILSISVLGIPFLILNWVSRRDLSSFLQSLGFKNFSSNCQLVYAGVKCNKHIIFCIDLNPSL